jgi:CBS domain containing-hemolysin-like protein
LPDGEWDTVAGLVVGILGRVPEPNEEVLCDGAKFVVEQVEGHRVLSVRVTKIADEPAEDEETATVES